MDGKDRFTKKDRLIKFKKLNPIKAVSRWILDNEPLFKRFYPLIPSHIRNVAGKILFRTSHRDFTTGGSFFHHFDHIEMDPHQVRVSGWFISEPELAGIELHIDGLACEPHYECGRSRPDVGVIYPHCAGSRYSGFYLHCDFFPPLCFGEHSLEFTFRNKDDDLIVIEKKIEVFDHYSDYLERNRQPGNRENRPEDSLDRGSDEPDISIILFQENYDRGRFQGIMDALGNQTRPLIRLIIVTTRADDLETREKTISMMVPHDYIFTRFEDLNTVLGRMDGEWLAFVGPNSVLMPNCLQTVNQVIKRDHRCQLIYADEDRSVLERKDSHFFKPDFSAELLLSVNYIGELFFIQKDLYEKIEGINPYPVQEAFHDLLLRASEKAEHIVHIPRILHSVTAAPHGNVGITKLILEQAVIRRNLTGTVSLVQNDEKTIYSIKPSLKEKAKVTIIILTAYQAAEQNLLPCLESISSRSTYGNYEVLIVDNSRGRLQESHIRRLFSDDVPVDILDYPGEFNYSKMNNFAARQARGDNLVLLNDDIEIVTPDWMEQMLAISQFPNVGVVGCKLLFPDDTIQHAGVIILPAGPVHPFRFSSAQYSGYNDLIAGMRNWSAVTFACALIPKQVYERVGGLSERLPVEFNDVDFCLEVGRQGYRIVWTPFVVHYHKESASRSCSGQVSVSSDLQIFKDKWGALLVNGDPFFNPNLTLTCELFSFSPTGPGPGC